MAEHSDVDHVVEVDVVLDHIVGGHIDTPGYMAEGNLNSLDIHVT